MSLSFLAGRTDSSKSPAWWVNRDRRLGDSFMIRDVTILIFVAKKIFG
jgi:hypothetical protein